MSNSTDLGGKEQPSYPLAATDNSEKLRERIKRHLKEAKAGNFDPRALTRGGNQIIDRLTLGREDEGDLTITETVPDYQEISGLDFNSYILKIPVGPRRSVATLELPTFRNINIRILDFPVDSRFAVFVTHEGQKPVHTSTFLNRIPGAIASITGPTFARGDNLPNNGFFFRPTGDTRPFMETNPPGERRGAFGLTDSGDLQLMTDAQKWAIVNNEFAGYQVLAGTSHFILGTDSDQDYSNLAQTHKNCLSYLMQSQQPDGRVRFSFVRNERMLSRDRLRKVMQNHSARTSRQMFMAVELEFGNASAIVRSAQGKSGFGTGFNDRRDHYIFIRD